MTLSRESIQRMITDMVGGGGGGAGISGSALANLLTGYATQDWVGENYISIEFFSRLFQAHGTENGQQTDITPNDMDSTITSIEALFGFWTDLYISALGNGGSIGSSIYLSTLADVQLSSPATGQVLTYNASTGKWVNANPQGGVTDLASLTDVTLTSLQNGQTLLYNSTTSKWYNSALKTINGQSLLGSGDISVGGGASGNYLPLSGGTLTGDLYFTNNGTERVRIFTDSEGGNIRITSPNGIYWEFDAYDNELRFFCVNPWTRLTLERDGKIDWSGHGFFVTNSNTTYTAGRYGIQANAGVLLLSSPSGKISFSIPGTNALEINFNNCTGVKRWIINNTGGIQPESANAMIMGGNGHEFSNIDSRVVWARHLNYSRSYGDGNDLYIQYDIDGACGNTYMNYTSGNVCIRTSSASYTLNVGGTIYATGAITALSDARKKDITGEAGVTVEQIAHAPAVQFLWKDKERRKDGQQVGTLAQYWQAVLPEVVMDKGGELSMQYGVAALVSAIITARKVVDHERRIQELEKENQDLRREISNIRVKTNIHMRGGIG